MESRSFRTLVAALLVAFSAAARSNESSPRPPCGRTAWLAVSTPETIVHPGDSTDIMADVVLVPYVDWSTAPGCAQPQSVTLSLSLNCFPSDGGAPIQVAPVFVPIAVPTTPGIQPLMTGNGMTYTFTVPAGTLPSGVSYRCSVFGSLSVVFTAGTGATPVSALGSAALCITEPSPASAAFPRVGLRRLNLGDDGYLLCRKGDEGLHYYEIANNDDTTGVALELLTRSNQIAKTPINLDATTTFALASDKPDRDNFPLRFADLVDQGQLVPLGDPTKKDTQEISRAIYLGPGEVRVVAVVARSYGGCALASCCQLRAEIEGTFDDGTPAVGCASTAIVVADVPAKSPLFEFTDEVKTDDSTDATWSGAVFDGDELAATLAAGNLFDDQGGPGTRTVGASLPDTTDYPPTAADSIRNESSFDTFTYVVEALTDQSLEAQETRVIVTGFAASVGSLSIPVFARSSATNFKLVIDAAAETARLFDLDKKKDKQLIFDGAWSSLLGAPPGDVLVEGTTCRTFTRTDAPSEDFVAAFPAAGGFTFDDSATPESIFVDVLDPRPFDAPLDWSASTDNLAAAPQTAMDVAGQPIVIDFDLGNIPSFPTSELTILSITSSNAFNDPFLVPLVTRKRTGVPAPDGLLLDKVAGKLLFKKKNKDKLTIEGTIPVPQGLQPQGTTAAISIGDLDFVFTLDKNGDAKSKTQSLEIDLKKKDGVVQAGDRTFVLTLKKQDLSGLFSQYGVRPDAPSGSPAFAHVAIKVRFFDGQVFAWNVIPLVFLVTPKSAPFVIAET